MFYNEENRHWQVMQTAAAEKITARNTDANIVDALEHPIFRTAVRLSEIGGALSEQPAASRVMPHA
jgi:hypothetical protein